MKVNLFGVVILANYLLSGGSTISASSNDDEDDDTTAFKSRGISIWGYDVSQAVNKTQWDCLKAKTPLRYAVVRLYHGNGTANTNAPSTIKLALEAGFDVSGYIQPCKKCGNPRDQTRNSLAALGADAEKLRAVFVSVQASGPDAWKRGSTEENVQFLRELVQELESKNAKVGIFTNQRQWERIMGSTKDFGKHQLWYMKSGFMPSCRTVTTFFEPFGGWESPFLNQYVTQTEICGVKVGIDWFWWSQFPYV